MSMGFALMLCAYVASSYLWRCLVVPSPHFSSNWLIRAFVFEYYFDELELENLILQDGQDSEQVKQWPMSLRKRKMQ